MPHTLKEIAAATGAELRGDPDCIIHGVGALDTAGPGQITFLGNPRLSMLLSHTRASAVILRQADLGQWAGHALLVRDPYVAYVHAANLLHPEPGFTPGIDANADVHESAQVAPSAYVGPTAVVGERCVIGGGCYIGPGCVLGDGVVLGSGTRLVANVVLCHGVTIGERTLVHPGAVIGADGFGLARDQGTWLKMPQLGTVRIGCDVEIGANTTIDRGALEDTVVEDGVKIDNLVQIGHNVQVGAHTAIAGCAVIAGSVKVGRRCMIGGASALSGHIEIADDVVITGMSGVPNSVRTPGMYSGAIPIMDNLVWRKNMARLKHLDELARKVQALERALENLTRSASPGD